MSLSPLFLLLNGSIFSCISQDESGAVISQISDISNRDGHATDEEKLASTSSGQKSTGAEVKGEPDKDLEYFECSSVPAPPVNHAFSSSKAGMEAFSSPF